MKFQCVVKPKSKVNSILVNKDGSLRIKIKAIPVDGKANEYLVKYLASVFSLSNNRVQILSGFAGSYKRINIVAEEANIKSILQKL
jgi:uncharacterized protein